MNITTKRKSNIELLRVLCMICLVAHHFTIHGNLYLNENIFVQRFSLIFAPLGKMCYVVFMVISSYFLSNANVKSKRFWKVWMEVLFYNILMMLATLVGSGWNGLLSIKMIVGSILPMLGASHGYAVAYLWLLAFLPFIKILQEKMNEYFLGNLIFLLFSLEIVSWIIGSFIDYNAGIKSELFFFVLIYYSTLYLKKYDEKLLHVSRKTLFSWGGVCVCIYLIEYLIWYIGVQNSNHIFQILLTFINNQRSPLNILFGYTVFYIFMNIHINYSKVINRMASTTFAILLIHDSNYFRNLIWNYISRSPIGQHLWRSKIEFIFTYFIIVIGLSGFCCLIDLIRQNTVDKLVMNSHVFTTLCEKTNMNGNAE